MWRLPFQAPPPVQALPLDTLTKRQAVPTLVVQTNAQLLQYDPRFYSLYVPPPPVQSVAGILTARRSDPIVAKALGRIDQPGWTQPTTVQSAFASLTAVALTNRTLTADQGTYALTGIDAGLLAARNLVADFGTYALTGQAAGLLFNSALAADFGVYALTGIDAGLVYSGATPPTVISGGGGVGTARRFSRKRYEELLEEWQAERGDEVKPTKAEAEEAEAVAEEVIANLGGLLAFDLSGELEDVQEARRAIFADPAISTLKAKRDRKAAAEAVRRKIAAYFAEQARLAAIADDEEALMVLFL